MAAAAGRNQACGQQEFWGLIAVLGFQEHSPSGAAAGAGGAIACRQWKFWGLIFGMGFRECSTVALLVAGGNQTCWLEPSVSCGAVGAIGPVSTGVPVSLAFQGEGSRSCSVGSVEL
jgi:hypothetical protein